MILIENYAQVAAQIETERGISRDELTQAIEQALISACRRQVGDERHMEASIDAVTGEAKVWLVLRVVDEIEDEIEEITVSDAQKYQDGAKAGDVIRHEIEESEFGRIAAQTAKQVIIQRIREAEKNSIYEEFDEKIGQLIVGTVQRVEGPHYLLDLGRVEALLSSREQIPGERFDVKEKVRVVVVDVLRTPKGPKILISRGHGDMLKCLFELEVPEIQDGIIEIKSISREPGRRAKVAVSSNNPSVGAVGTCVGHMGGRIQAILKEIGDEKIDILEWDADPRKFIANSLKPAEISDVIITSEEEKTAVVVVAKDQLSLAIGKAGVNVRLAVKLTGWKLDIYSQEEYKQKADEIHKDMEHVSIVDKIQQDVQDMKDESSEDEGPGFVLKDTDLSGTPMEEEPAEPEGMPLSVMAQMLDMDETELMKKAAELGLEIEDPAMPLSPDQLTQLQEGLS